MTDGSSATITAALVHRAAELEPTRGGLTPHQYRDGQLLMPEAQPAGVRLVFRTRATVIALDSRPEAHRRIGSRCARLALGGGATAP